jgi:hypothetical protein
MGSYCGLLYKIVVSIGNAKITSSWNMIGFGEEVFVYIFHRIFYLTVINIMN